MSRRRPRPPTWPDWYFPKRYPHFDRQISSPEQVQALVESPGECARRAFLPFIRFVRTARKYKKERRPDGSVGGEFKKKERDLKCASHTDSQILRHYANMLSARYESLIAAESLSGSVLAYRKIGRGKSNIDFAEEAFRWIKSNASCVVQTFDVKDFFESLDHRILKQRWKEVLSTRELPPDHYNVFKAVTRYAWVERSELYLLFGISKKKQKTWRVPICTPEEFRRIVRGEGTGVRLISQNPKDAGVPQGSPISALLSNIYMLSVDRQMVQCASDVDGLYLRYSDDILIACKSDAESTMTSRLFAAMAEVRLELHDGLGKRTRCEIESCGGGALKCRPPLQYLGFTFDGQTVRIRSQTLVRFRRRMVAAVRRERLRSAQRAEAGGDARIRRKRLYRLYTHLGRRNFITGYAADAQKVFSRNSIRKQLRSLWKLLHSELEE